MIHNWVVDHGKTNITSVVPIEGFVGNYIVHFTFLFTTKYRLELYPTLQFQRHPEIESGYFLYYDPHGIYRMFHNSIDKSG